MMKALCTANQGILRQKLGLLTALRNKHGDDGTAHRFQIVCPVVRATLGQHLRHSLDHMEGAVRMALLSSSASSSSDGSAAKPLEVQYDRRARETSDERDWRRAQARIERVSGLFDSLILCHTNDDAAAANTISNNITTESSQPENRVVHAYFMLSGDQNDEYCLSSTVGRELGFCAHHAIHHMALLQLLATNRAVGGLDEADLPRDFGRAPSTVHYHHDFWLTNTNANNTIENGDYS